jgi:hypothetical protein
MGRIGLSELIIMLVVYVIPVGLFIYNCNGILKNIKPENQKIKKNSLNKLFIPLYGMYWVFVVIKNINSSIQEELQSSQMNTNRSLKISNLNGVLYCISFLPLFAVGFIISNLIITYKSNNFNKK